MRNSNSTKTRRAGAAGVCAALALLMSACGISSKATEQFKDADVSSRNEGPAIVISMPDGYSNVAAKCDGKNMVYVAFHGISAYGALAVVKDDPRCTGG